MDFGVDINYVWNWTMNLSLRKQGVRVAKEKKLVNMRLELAAFA